MRALVLREIPPVTRLGEKKNEIIHFGNQLKDIHIITT
jgi:hypothetical protein